MTQCELFYLRRIEMILLTYLLTYHANYYDFCLVNQYFQSYSLSGQDPSVTSHTCTTVNAVFLTKVFRFTEYVKFKYCKPR